jgi:type III secretory pathway component EscS
MWYFTLPFPLDAERQVFLVVGLLVILTCSLVGPLSGRLTAKQTRSLHFISALVAVFVLVGFLYPWSRELLRADAEGQTLGRVVAVCLFFGLLALFRLMGRFESPG